MPNHLASIPFEGRHGSYEINVYHRTEIGEAPVTLDAEEGVRLRFGALQPGFGGGLVGAELTADVFDDGTLAGAFAGEYDERDYLITVEGPSGLGHDLYAELMPLQGEGASRTVAPAVHTARRFPLVAYCGAGALSGRRAPGMKGAGLATVLARLSWAQDLPVLGAVTLWPDVATDALLSRVAFTENTLGSGVGDYGTAADQLALVARAWHLSIFQAWRQIGGAATWLALPRSRVGLAQDVTRINDGAPAAEALPAYAYALAAEDWHDDGEVPPVRKAGTVIIPVPGGALITDPTFEERNDSGHPFYWEGDFDPDALGDGQELSQRFAVVSAEPGVYVRITLRQAAATDTISYVAPADARLKLYGANGVTYWADENGEWQTSETTLGLGTGEGTGTGALTELTEAAVTVEPFPVSGELEAGAVGGAVDFGGLGTITSEVRELSAVFEDDLGDVIDEWTVTAGGGGGETVEVPDLGTIEAYNGSAWTDTFEWESDITGGTYDVLQQGTGAERVATHGRKLSAVAATVEGLVGPEVRVTFPGTDTDPDSPFTTATACVAVGLELDFLRGVTRGVWVEAIEDAA